MKINPKLLQIILEQVENKHDLKEEFINIGGYDAFLVGWHCNHLIKNNLVNGIVSEPIRSVLTPTISEITMKGTEYLRDLQSKSGWRKYWSWIKTNILSLPGIIKLISAFGGHSNPPAH
jgi:hypothetical protein